MRILLLTLHETLPLALTQVLNSSLECCAIVTDEIEAVKILADKIGLNKNLIRPMYELKECIADFYYDCLVLISDPRTVNLIPEKLRKLGLPKNKFIHIYLTQDSNHYLMIKRALNYYQEHSAEFEMFATGMSYTSFCLDSTKFKYKLFNFGRASQDLYYDYQIAKRIVTPKMGGGGRFITL